MSGPKLSEAELERIRQEQLERERQEALRKLMEARSQYSIHCREVKRYKEYVIDALSKIDATYRSSIESEILALLDEIRDKNIVSSNPEDYIVATQRINRNFEPWKNRIEAILKKGQDKTNNESDLSKSNNDLQDFSVAGLRKKGEIRPMQIDFTCQYDEKKVAELLKETRNHFEKRINTGSDMRLLSFDQKALSEIKRISIGVMSVDEVKNRIQQIINEEEDQIRLLKKFDDLYEKYVTISLVLGNNPRKKSEFTTESVSKEITLLEDEYRRRDEMDYIADQINEVMVQQGYSLVTSKVLRKKNSGETEYSLYQEEGKSGVAVYTDDTGAVMMQMTVLGDGSDITDEDRDFSYQRQIDFCSTHEDLVVALAKRGVYLKQKSYQAPDRRHTFKVDVSGQVDVSSGNSANSGASKDKKVNRRSRRRGGNTKMRSV